MRRFLSYLFAVAIAVCSSPRAGRAAPLSFEDLVREALLKSPEAANIDATLAERAAEAFGVKAKENPVLNVALDVPVGTIPRDQTEKPEVSLSLSQALRASDFGERRALAALINETADVEKTTALNGFILDLSLLYGRAWQYQETEVILAEAGRRAELVLAKVSKGAARGLFPQGDVELFKAELKTFEAEILAARGELSRAKAELTRLSGVALSHNVLTKPSDTPPMTRGELLDLTQRSQLPFQQRYKLLQKMSQKQLEVARLDSFPVLSPSVGFGRHDDGVEQVMVGVSISLPFFNRNQGEQMRARGALAAADRSENYANSERLTSEVLLLLEALSSTRDQVTLFESGVIPAKRRAVEAYQRQFDVGAGTAFQLWQAQRELNQSSLRALELRNALLSISNQLNALVGNFKF